MELIIILVFVMGVLIAVGSIAMRNEAKKAYLSSLEELKQSPNNPDLREKTLKLGRQYSKLMRGQKGKDIEAAVDCLMNTAALVRDNPVIAEVDINPIVVFESGAMVLDARILLQREA